MKSEVGPARSVGDLLAFLEPELSAAIGAAGAGRLLERAASFPLPAFGMVGFEVPLRGATGVDLLLQLGRPPALRRVMLFERDLPSELGGGPPLGGLLEALSDRSDALFRRVDDAWLEYDVGSGDGRVPSLFGHPSTAATAAALARLLASGALTERAHTRFEALVRALAHGEWPQQVGVMHGRARPDLRCVIGSAGSGAIPGREALQRAGWPLDFSRIAQAVGRYVELAPMSSLAVGIDGGGTPLATGGVELHLPRRADADRLLAALVDHRLASPEIAARLRGWHGHRLDPMGTGSPQGLVALARVTGGRLVPGVVRRIHHVKLTVRAGAAPTAKAYLGARFQLAGMRWISRPPVNGHARPRSR